MKIRTGFVSNSSSSSFVFSFDHKINLKEALEFFNDTEIEMWWDNKEIAKKMVYESLKEELDNNFTENEYNIKEIEDGTKIYLSKSLFAKWLIENFYKENYDINIEKEIDKKIKKFDSYKKFDKNILLVHSEIRASLDINIVIEKLANYTLNTNILFDFIFLKLSNKIYYFTNNTKGNCTLMT